MPINIPDIKERTKEAVSLFWKTRQQAVLNQQSHGHIDQGGRSAVTAGKNLDGFINLIKTVVVENGLSETDVLINSRLVTLPGFFRPTKNWDILIVHDGLLVAAIELKSQVGPSFGNNFNNRCEEALGTATDLWTAYRESAFGNSSKPFVGYFVLLEDCVGTQSPVKESSPHFPVFPEYSQSSYSKRYALLCEKLVKENLYTSTALLLSPSKEGLEGEYTEPLEICSLNRMIIELAGHIAATAVIANS